jgi:ATP-dependent exoDNAse (exonuclease V) beta subunit
VQELFEEQLPTCPDPESAAKDWKATRQNLFNDASIARFLASDETLFYSEFPFLWRRNDRSVLEGLIDSIMVNRKAGRCLLLDWKTNDVSSSDAEIFRTRYRPQLAVLESSRGNYRSRGGSWLVFDRPGTFAALLKG